MPKQDKATPVPPLLLPLIAIYFLSGMALSGGRVAASLYALHLGTSEVMVGMLFGLYGTLPMFLSLYVGRWVDRIGPFIPICLGVAALVIGITLAATVPHVSVLFVMAALAGIGFNLVTVAGQYTVGQLSNGSSAQRVVHFSWLSLGQSCANVAGPIVAGLLIDFAGYHWAFTALAGLAGCAALVVLIQAPLLRALEAKRAAAPRAANTRVWSLVSTASMKRIYVTGVLLSVSWDVFLLLIPILGHRQELPASVIGAILAAFAAGTFSIRLIMPWFSARFTEWKILRASIVIIVVVFLVLPMTNSVAALFSIAYLFGMAVGCSQPNMLALLHATAPPGRGAEAVGFRQMLCNASGVFVPLTFGLTAASLGLMPTFWAVAAMMAMVLPAAHRETVIQAQSHAGAASK